MDGAFPVSKLAESEREKIAPSGGCCFIRKRVIGQDLRCKPFLESNFKAPCKLREAISVSS